MARSSPLAALTRSAGATFTEAAGWELPLYYRDALAEYELTLREASLFDLSHHGKLEVAGLDAPSFLHNLCTNDIKNLPLGGGCEAYFCNAKAKTLAHALIYHVLLASGKHGFYLDVAPGFGNKLLGHLDRHLIAEQVELTDRTLEFVHLHLAGPKTGEVLGITLGEAVPPLEEFQHMERTFGKDVTCHLRRNDRLGVPGFDIVCLNARAEDLLRMLTSAGARPAGLQAEEWLRVEAVAPVYGVDIDEDRFVMEVPRALRAVSYNKGCYLGQEPIVMARDRAGHVNRAFLPLKVLEGGVISGRAKLLKDGADVGLITSCIQSPRLGSPLALGYVRRGFQEPGTRLQAETSGGSQAVEVLSMQPILTAPEAMM